MMNYEIFKEVVKEKFMDYKMCIRDRLPCRETTWSARGSKAARAMSWM